MKLVPVKDQVQSISITILPDLIQFQANFNDYDLCVSFRFHSIQKDVTIVRKREECSGSLLHW